MERFRLIFSIHLTPLPILSIPIMFGLAGIAVEFTPWFFGPGFKKTGTLIAVISPIILFIAWNNILGQQYLLPFGKIRTYTTSVCTGAIVNFVFNIFLIINFDSIGAAFATVIAEFAVTLVQLYWIRKDIELSKLFVSLWEYLIIGLIMFGSIRILGSYFGAGFSTTMLQIVIGATIYFTMLFQVKSELNKKILVNGYKRVRNVLVK